MGDRGLQGNDKAASSSRTSTAALIPDHFFKKGAPAPKNRPVQTVILSSEEDTNSTFVQHLLTTLNDGKPYTINKVKQPPAPPVKEKKRQMESLGGFEEHIIPAIAVEDEDKFYIQNEFFSNFKKDTVLNIVAIGHAGFLLVSFLNNKEYNNNSIISGLEINLMMIVDLGDNCSLQFKPNVNNENYKNEDTIEIHLPYTMHKLLNPTVNKEFEIEENPDITIKHVKHRYIKPEDKAQHNLLNYATQSFLRCHGENLIKNDYYQTLEKAIKNYHFISTRYNHTKIINDHHKSLMPNLLLRNLATEDETVDAILQMTRAERLDFVHKYYEHPSVLHNVALTVFTKLPEADKQEIANNELKQYLKNKAEMPKYNKNSPTLDLVNDISEIIDFETKLRTREQWKFTTILNQNLQIEDEIFIEQTDILQCLYERLRSIHRRLKPDESNLTELVREMDLLEQVVNKAAEAKVYDPSNPENPALLITDTSKVDIHGLIEYIKLFYLPLFLKQEYTNYKKTKLSMPTFISTDTAQDITNKIIVMIQIEKLARKAEYWPHSTRYKKTTPELKFFEEQKTILECFKRCLSNIIISANYRSIAELTILQNALHHLINAKVFDPVSGSEVALLNKNDSQDIFELYNTTFEAYVLAIRNQVADPILDEVATSTVSISNNYLKLFTHFKNSMVQYHAIAAKVNELVTEANTKQFNPEVMTKLNNAVIQLKETMRNKLPEILSRLFMQYIDDKIILSVYQHDLQEIKAEANKLFPGEVDKLLPDVINKICNTRSQEYFAKMTLIMDENNPENPKVKFQKAKDLIAELNKFYQLLNALKSDPTFLTNINDNLKIYEKWLNDKIEKHCIDYFLEHVTTCGTEQDIKNVIKKTENELTEIQPKQFVQARIMHSIHSKSKPWIEYQGLMNKAYNDHWINVKNDINKLMEEYERRANSHLYIGYRNKKNKIVNVMSHSYKPWIEQLVAKKMAEHAGKEAPEAIITPYELTQEDKAAFKAKFFDDNIELRDALNISRYKPFDNTRTWFYNETRFGKQCHKFFHHTNEPYKLTTPTHHRVESFFKPRKK